MRYNGEWESNPSSKLIFINPVNLEYTRRIETQPEETIIGIWSYERSFRQQCVVHYRPTVVKSTASEIRIWDCSAKLPGIAQFAWIAWRAIWFHRTRNKFFTPGTLLAIIIPYLWFLSFINSISQVRSKRRTREVICINRRSELIRLINALRWCQNK